MRTDLAAWQAWFEEAAAARSGGDLAFLADEAPSRAARNAARIAAIEALLITLALPFASEQIAKLELDALPQAQPFRERLERLAANSADSLPPAFVFSGHMVDAVDRVESRFPAGAAPGVARAIRQSLLTLGAKTGSLVTCSAAAGSDLLFLEAATSLRLETVVCLPFSEERFVESSVIPGGAPWERRYPQLTRAPGVTLRVLPLETPPGADPYERCNRWMVSLARAGRGRKVHGIVVWDGEDGDGPGGAAHMVAELRAHNLPALIIDPGAPS